MSKFNVDDKVRVVNDHGIWLVEGLFCLPDDAVLTVVHSDCPSLDDREICIENVNDWPEDFELVTLPTHEQNPEVILPITRDQSEPLGVFRPNLGDRKVGKVPMHMVVDGFPNALKHIAEIMGWAEQVKGYKLHDWANLPNAEVAFPSAEYRHSGENSIQKAQGLNALERVDHESGKLHTGHKIFNALCELELVLRGVIK